VLLTTFCPVSVTTGNWLLTVLELVDVLSTDVFSPVPVLATVPRSVAKLVIVAELVPLLDTVPRSVAKLVIVAEVTCVSLPVDGTPNAPDDAFNPAARSPDVGLGIRLSVRITLELLPEPSRAILVGVGRFADRSPS
jgi:hypothetical protein